MTTQRDLFQEAVSGVTCPKCGKTNLTVSARDNLWPHLNLHGSRCLASVDGFQWRALPVSKPNVSTKVSPSTKDDICENYHKGNPMSVQANKIAHDGKVSARMRILDEIQMSNGMTCEELEHWTGLSHQTCSARLSDLKREGKIKIVGTRKTRSGSPAAIYQTI